MRLSIRTVALAATVALAGCSGSNDAVTRPEGGVRPLGISNPDLVITAFEITAVTNNSVTYEWTIMNIGDAPADLEGPTLDTADNVSVQALLSQNTTFGDAGDMPAGGTVLGSSPIAPLAPGASLSGSFSSNTPGANPCDFAYLTLMVDWGESLFEYDETNNFAFDEIVCCPELEIDIKPGSDVNPVNPKSNGVIPVAILGSASLDVTDIDVDSIEFGPWGATEAHGTGHYEDVNDDGYVDLMLHFRTQDTGIGAGATEACLTADYDGAGGLCSLSNCDNISTVPPPEVAGP